MVLQSQLYEVKLFIKVASPWLQVQLKVFKVFKWPHIT